MFSTLSLENSGSYWLLGLYFSLRKYESSTLSLLTSTVKAILNFTIVEEYPYFYLIILSCRVVPSLKNSLLEKMYKWINKVKMLRSSFQIHFYQEIHQCLPSPLWFLLTVHSRTTLISIEIPKHKGKGWLNNITNTRRIGLDRYMLQWHKCKWPYRLMYVWILAP